MFRPSVEFGTKCHVSVAFFFFIPKVNLFCSQMSCILAFKTFSNHIEQVGFIVVFCLKLTAIMVY